MPTPSNSVRAGHATSDLTDRGDAPAFRVQGGLALLFGALGVLLAGYGCATRGDAELYVKSGYVNVNLRWGLVLLGCGALMSLVALLSARFTRASRGEPVANSVEADADLLRDR